MADPVAASGAASPFRAGTVLRPPRPSLLDAVAHSAVLRALAAWRDNGGGQPPLLLDGTAGNGHDCLFLARQAPAGSLLLDSRRAEACSANFEKVRRYVKRLCARTLPRLPEGTSASEELRLLSAITPKGPVFYRGTVQALADRYVVFHDDYGAVSRLLLELIRAEALARGYHIITCPCAMHPDDKIDHLFIPALRLAFLTDNRWHPVQLPGVQAVRCTRFVDRENLAGYRARLRFNERAAAELLEQAADLMAQAKACHDELETYYRAAVDFGKVDEAAAQCAGMLGLA